MHFLQMIKEKLKIFLYVLMIITFIVYCYSHHLSAQTIPTDDLLYKAHISEVDWFSSAVKICLQTEALIFFSIIVISFIQRKMEAH